MAPFRLTICGLGEIAEHCARDGVTDVVSILDPDWPTPEDLALYAGARRLMLRFHDEIDPHPGIILPDRADVAQLLAFGRGLAQQRQAHLLVHCHAGVSRSTAAASLVLAQAAPERPAAAAIEAVAALRPQAWPNLRIIELGDELLGRGGEIVDATRAHYRRMLEAEPWRAEVMIDAGRGREVR
jgi:predicted protein tyrosine phosphatase